MLGAITRIGESISRLAGEYYKAFEEVADEAGAFDGVVGQETRSIMRRFIGV